MEGNYVFMMGESEGGTPISLYLTIHLSIPPNRQDPLWNKASEEQAFDRCYRLGSTKDVTVVRYEMMYKDDQRSIEVLL